MANVNIHGTPGSYKGNDYTVPHPAKGTPVSFETADSDCVICFDTYATFDSWGFTLKRGNPQHPKIQNVHNTGYTINALGTNCPQSRPPMAGPGYVITMGGGLPKGQKKS